MRTMTIPGRWQWQWWWHMARLGGCVAQQESCCWCWRGEAAPRTLGAGAGAEEEFLVVLFLYPLTPPQNIAKPLLSPPTTGTKPRDVRTAAESKYVEIKMCLSGGKLFINQNARFQFSKGGPFEKSENTHTATVLNWNKTQLVFSTNACRIQKVGLFNDSFNNFEDNCKYLRFRRVSVYLYFILEPA